MLGNLARRLRWLGYDAEYRSDLPDEVMMQIAQEEGRMLITSDRGLAGRRGLRSLFLPTAELSVQVESVMAALGLPTGPSRCTVCNGDLEPLERVEASPLVPPYVAATQTEFACCSRCHRVYWPGTHWSGLQAWRTHNVAYP